MKTDRSEKFMDQGLYDQDFYQWALKNAELVRQGKFSEMDSENIAEELESMGLSQKRELESRLIKLIMHLLKWRYQSERQSRSWKSTINTQRREIERLLKTSPSLKYSFPEVVKSAYPYATREFDDETGISRKKLPESCPFSPEQLMDEDFWPE